MSECNRCEIRLSEWLDGELDRAGQEAMLDHLVGCSGCRDFYREGRGLAGLLAAVGSPAAAAAPSPDVWRRIERSARRPAWRPLAGWGERMRRLPIRGWAAAAAAAVVLVALGSLLQPPGRPVISPPAEKAIRLGGNPAGMDDARFVALTREVLEADRKYRVAFYEVLRQVARDADQSEGSVDLLPAGAENGPDRESPETTGGPS